MFLKKCEVGCTSGPGEARRSIGPHCVFGSPNWFRDIKRNGWWDCIRDTCRGINSTTTIQVPFLSEHDDDIQRTYSNL